MTFETASFFVLIAPKTKDEIWHYKIAINLKSVNKLF
jgi:hypothetical protein